MTDDITIDGICTSIWHSHRVNQKKDPYALDLVLEDNESNSIQVYIKRELMYKYELISVDGQCYQISNFGGKLPLLAHKFKISFHRNTTVAALILLMIMLMASCSSLSVLSLTAKTIITRFTLLVPLRPLETSCLLTGLVCER